MIEVSNLGLSLPGFLLKDINLNVNKGEFFALLGPTGSGKTVLLEAIAGLMQLDKGQIIINGKDISNLNPEHRNISIVYQDYALFPNMNIKDNITYGLRFKNEVKNYHDKFDMLVEMLSIGKLINRYPHNLSGGEKQRAALARALIVEPDVLLLDEPFSALDVNTKEIIQKEIKKIHTALGTTTIMVTHNFSEVFALADKVAIIYRGTIEQEGTVRDVFRNPKSNFVAEFVGMKNIFSPDLLLVDKQVQHCFIGIRPEDIFISRNNLQTDYQLKGAVTSILNNGIYLEASVKTKNIDFTVYLIPNHIFESELNINESVYLGFNQKDINIIQRDKTL